MTESPNRLFGLVCLRTVNTLGASTDRCLILEGTAIREARVEGRPREEIILKKSYRFNRGKLQLEEDGQRLIVPRQDNAIVFD
jgi:hypothetical protein